MPVPPVPVPPEPEPEPVPEPPLLDDVAMGATQAMLDNDVLGQYSRAFGPTGVPKYFCGLSFNDGGAPRPPMEQ